MCYFFSFSGVRCPFQNKSLSSCFKFNLKDKKHPKILRKREANLWLWKKRDEESKTPQIITISQVIFFSQFNYNESTFY